MKVFVTYHPAAYLHAEKAAGGLSRETILTCMETDLDKVLGEGSPILEPPKRVMELMANDGPRHRHPTVIGVDTEYGGPGYRDMYTVAVATGTEVMGCNTSPPNTPPIYNTTPLGVVTPNGVTPYVDPLTGVSLRDIGGVIGGADVLIAHSAQGDIQQLWEKGLIPKREEYLTGEAVLDSYTVSRMAYENHPSYKLEDLFANFYTFKGWKEETKHSRKAEDWTPEERLRRCELDAWGGYKVAEHEWPKVDPKLYAFTQRTAMALHRLTLAGAFVDLDTFDRMDAKTKVDRAAVLTPLRTAAMRLGIEEFEPTNDDQLRDILFTRLGLSPIEYTGRKRLPSVTKEVLGALAESAEGGTKGFIEALVEFNRVDKLRSTYVTSLWDTELGEGLMYPMGRMADDSRVAWLPFNFHTLGAKTGRRSSSEPNSQNWPKSVRSYVRSRWVGGSILECDYRKLEPRIIAWLAGSDKLLDFFVNRGGYIDIAKELFHTDVAEGTVLYRGVKSIVLGVHYDMQTPKMASELWVKNGIRFSADYKEHVRITDEIRRQYLTVFPEIAVYFEGKWSFLDTHGYVESPTGRKRRLGGNAGKHERNQAINFPVQSTASDVTGAAIVDVEAALLAESAVSLPEFYDALLAARRGYLTFAEAGGIIGTSHDIPCLFNEVHDSLLTDIPPDKVKRITELVVETMRAVPSLREFCPELAGLPLDVDVKLGPRWGG